MNKITLRLATIADLPVLLGVDAEIADPSTLDLHGVYYREWVGAGECWLAQAGQEPVGLAVLHRHFFHRDFVELLLVRPAWQGRGVGGTILRGLAGIAEGPRVWISTNRSNAAMQKLLAKEGFVYAGTIEGLDEGDPELFYWRAVDSACF
ncbi:MAG: GNAT family N-acetyltransferase [Devosia sp.]|nr:GNAT family N-acetyltransferase [Devosia sp.]